MPLYDEAEEIERDLNHLAGLQLVLGEQAQIYAAQGQRSRAMALLKKKEEICKTLNNPQGLVLAIANQGNLLLQYATTHGEVELGIDHIERACKIARMHGLTQLANMICPILKNFGR